MSNLNYVGGLHRVRVTYPLAFEAIGHAYPGCDPTYTILAGAGFSTSYREASSLASGKFLNFLFSGTGANMEGLHLDVTFSAGGTTYGMYLKTISTYSVVTGVRYGFLSVIQNSATGAQCGGNVTTAIEASTIIDSTISNPQKSYALCLRITDNSTGHVSSDQAVFIRIRDSGTSPAKVFIEAADWDAAGGEGDMMRTNTHAATHGIRCLIGGNRYDLLVSDTHS